jgi:hypothetical protein
MVSTETQSSPNDKGSSKLTFIRVVAGFGVHHERLVVAVLHQFVHLEIEHPLVDVRMKGVFTASLLTKHPLLSTACENTNSCSSESLSLGPLMVHLSPSQIVNRKACAVAASEESTMSAPEQSIFFVLAGMRILVFDWVSSRVRLLIGRGRNRGRGGGAFVFGREIVLDLGPILREDLIHSS